VDAFIPVPRARRAVRLLGEAREIGAGTEAARQHLADRLLAELGAVIGGAVRDERFARGGKRGCVRATLTGFDGRTVPVYTAHDLRGSDFNPCLRAIMARRAAGDRHEVLTAAEDQAVERRDWERSEWVVDYVRPAGVAHFLASLRFRGAGWAEGFGFMRAAGDRPFSAEDRALLELVVLECGDLFGDAATERRLVHADRRTPRLAPRARTALDLLLTGASDKEIACSMELSTHTVRQYAKAVYRAFGVSGRAELLARHLPP